MPNSIRVTWCIVTADGSRARFFTLRAQELPQLEGGPDLVEHEDLFNPEQLVKPSERYATPSGRHRPPGGSLPHAYDDHRMNNAAENEARFARQVAEKVSLFTENLGAQHLVVSADPRLLGMLRRELSRRLAANLDVREVARDVSGLTRPQIHEQLSEAGVLPRRQPPATRRA
jgi:protein required for attachment to host cells